MGAEDRATLAVKNKRTMQNRISDTDTAMKKLEC